MRAEQVPADAADGFPAPGDFELAFRGLRAGFPSNRRVEPLDRRPRALAEHARNRWVSYIRHEQPAFRHGPHEVVELPLDRGKIVEDVAMIELNVIQNGGALTEVNEFG